jgi:cyclase
METIEVSPGVIAFVRPDDGANAGLIRTADGVVVVDTTSCASDVQELLDEAGVAASEARLVVNTHFHSDHTWGNQLFDCPILAHRLCRETMEDALAKEWAPEAIEDFLTDGEKPDPDWAREARRKWADLRITLPTEVFEDRRDLEIGGVRIEVIHLDAHTPDTAVVWLPEARVLFAGDLIFEGRYPFLYDADVRAWIAVLKRLPEFDAQVVVPGHGLLCGEAEIAALLDYLEATWARTADHLAQGHTADEAAADPNYPRYAVGPTEHLHEENIRVMHAQLVADS